MEDTPANWAVLGLMVLAGAAPLIGILFKRASAKTTQREVRQEPLHAHSSLGDRSLHAIHVIGSAPLTQALLNARKKEEERAERAAAAAAAGEDDEDESVESRSAVRARRRREIAQEKAVSQLLAHLQLTCLSFDSCYVAL